MKKCGLRGYAFGGFIDPNGSNYNAINAEKSARWANDALREDLKYADSSGEQAGLGKALAMSTNAYNERFVEPSAPARSAQVAAPIAPAASPRAAYNAHLGFKQGGTVGVDQRGFIKGPGGVDNVPARVDETGEEIRVGAGERIVNKDQNAALEALAAQAGMSLDEYLQSATGEEVGPTMKGGLRAAQNGITLYDPLLGQQPAPGGANTYAPRSTTPIQDGVRMGAPNQPPRPNFEHVSRAVAPVYDATTAGSHGGPAGNAANVIEGTARRVSVSGTPLVPTNGATQFHDKISAVEMARGNQNRAAGFRDAAEKASAGASQPAAHAAQAAPAGTSQAEAPKTRFQTVKSAAGSLAKGANIAAAVAGGGAELAGATEPSQAVMGGLKMSGALPGVMGIPGKVALYGDMAVQGLTGKSSAEWLDKAARLHPDYMLNKGREFGTAGLRSEAPAQGTPKNLSFNELSQSDPSYARTEASRAVAAPVMALEQNSDVKGLRAAGVTGPVVGDVRATEGPYAGKTAATGIRTIDTPQGNVFAGRDANGQLNVNFNSAMSQGQADAARDKDFEAKGYGKDAYGNWMTPQRIGMQQSLDKMQRSRAEFDAFDQSVTDPRARDAGLRAVMLNYAPKDKALADAATKQADRQVTMRGQDVTMNGQRVTQMNADREFGLKVGEANSKDLNGWMDTLAPTTGLKDEALAAAQTRRAVLQQALSNHWGGNIPNDRKAFQAAMPKMAMQAEGTMRLYDVLSKQGLVDRYMKNGGRDPALSLQAITPKSYDQSSDTLIMPDGYKVNGKDVWGHNADLREALVGRIQ